MNHKPLILITNDDGIDAPGIRALILAMTHIGEVCVVAPDRPQSGMSHAITINVPLRLKQLNTNEYSCSGTPVDCVKLGVKTVLKRKPDLIVSGINHGNNASINIIYSGTMAAAIEGTLEGIPSIGFSLDNFSYNADFSNAIKAATAVALKVLEQGLPHDICLNVNIPDIPTNEIKGFKVCRQAKAFWDEGFDTRQDPHHRPYYWLTGEFVNLDDGSDTDEHYRRLGYITLVPVQCDMTAHQLIPEFSEWNLQF